MLSRALRSVAATKRVITRTQLPRSTMIMDRSRYFSNKSGGSFSDMLKNLSGDEKEEEKKGHKPKQSAPKPQPAVDASKVEVQEEAAAALEREAKSESNTDTDADAVYDDDKEKEGGDNDEEVKESGPNVVERAREYISTIDVAHFVTSAPGRSRLAIDNLVESTKLAWDELLNPKKESVLERRVHQADSYQRKKKDDDNDDDDEEDDVPVKEKGPSAMVLVHEPTSQWEAMRNRLADSPVIREIFKRSKVVYSKAAATDAGAAATAAAERLQDKVHDAREFWETSQNPIVYTMSGVWDNMTSDTEEALVIKELLKLDPDFNKEEFLEELKVSLVPEAIKSHLDGKPKFLKKHCGEACYSKLYNDIQTRKSDKVTFEGKMVDLDESHVVMKFLESGSPVIVCMYMVQQINVVKKDGEIVDGDENKVVARFYSLAFQQQYEEDDGVVKWRIVDYEYGGDMDYY